MKTDRKITHQSGMIDIGDDHLVFCSQCLRLDDLDRIMIFHYGSDRNGLRGIHKCKEGGWDTVNRSAYEKERKKKIYKRLISVGPSVSRSREL